MDIIKFKIKLIKSFKIKNYLDVTVPRTYFPGCLVNLVHLKGLNR